MANMIPARIDGGAPSSEKRVFDLLERDPGTENWTVLHSLGLAQRPSGPFGEIDFVALIPGRGIVCLEVKGGRVSSSNGEWLTMNRSGQTNSLKSPFMQARDSMFALKGFISDEFGGGSPEAESPIGYMVVFPDVACPPMTPEFKRHEVIDHHDLQGPISISIMSFVRQRLDGFQPRNAHLPTPSEVKSVKNFLRPNFDKVVSRSVYLDRNQEKLLRLSEEQYERLDLLDANPRCLFEGPAGTGKTLLAVEYARRAARDGQKTLLICFNRLLAQWIKRQTEGANITADTWHEVTRQTILRSQSADGFLKEERAAFESSGASVRELFEETYPLYGEMTLEELGATFDTLVIDEAQDILADPHKLDFLNLALRGGLAGGRWAIFGDFQRQALYNDAEPMDPAKELSKYSDGRFTTARLTRNFRNTRRIAETTASVTGFDAPPFKMRDESGVPVEIEYWRMPSEQIESLTAVIEKMLADGVSAGDITLLSPSRPERSHLAGIEEICGLPIVDITDRQREIGESGRSAKPVIKLSTIHGFKGLESPVIIIMDIDRVDDDRSESLLYVGMTRAQSVLTLMVNRNVRKSVQSRIEAARNLFQK